MVPREALFTVVTTAALALAIAAVSILPIMMAG
jgi:hypothetical protein